MDLCDSNYDMDLLEDDLNSSNNTYCNFAKHTLVAYDASGKYGAENGFKPGYNQAVQNLLDISIPNSGLKADPHIKSRLKTWRTKFSIMHDMVFGSNTSGFGWDTEKCVLTAPDDVWDSYLKTHPEATKFRNKAFPLFDKLSTVFGKDRASGSRAIDLGDDEVVSEAHQTAPTNLEDKDIDKHVLPSPQGVDGKSTKCKRSKSDEFANMYSELCTMLNNTITAMGNDMNMNLNKMANDNDRKLESEIELMKKVQNEIDALLGITFEEAFEATNVIGKCPLKAEMLFGYDQGNKIGMVKMVARKSNKWSVKLPTRYNDHVMSNLSQNKANSKSIEDLDEIRVHNREKQIVSDELGVEEKGRQMDNYDVDNNECLDIGRHDCDEPCDEELKSGFEVSNKECLDEGSMKDKETVGVNKSASKENRSENYMKITNSASTNKEDRNELMNESAKLYDTENKSPKKTYASATKSSSYFETNKLLFVPTEINETGEEVIFDEDLVELGNILIEAWTTKGIGAISSSVDKPMIMNNMTTYVCKNRVGRTEFARVLGTKTVKVAYDWKPDVCSHCVVFGHDYKKCKVRTRTEEEVASEKDETNKTTHKENGFMQNDDSIQGISMMKDKMIVDKYLNMRLQPSFNVTKDCLDAIEGIVEDVLDDDYEAIKNLVADEVNGVGCSTLNLVCLSWFLNGLQNRITIGWNSDVVQVVLIHSTRHMMLCLIENIQNHEKMYCSFIYADNKGMDIRLLWNDLLLAKCCTVRCPWVIMGDFNVTLKLEEHSVGKSTISNDMQEFLDCMNNIGVEDLCISRMFYTWIKSPSSPDTRILKKLDRVMENDEFTSKYNNAHVVFHPFIVSDHSPAVLILPHGLMAKKLKLLKRHLNKLQWKNGDVFERVTCLRNKLKNAQLEVSLFPPDNEKKKIAATIFEEFSDAINDEGKLLFQKSKS
ncbi:probable L-cysteine desulfhydrase, chloroplastic [Tanacetum coccineum]